MWSLVGEAGEGMIHRHFQHREREWCLTGLGFGAMVRVLMLLRGTKVSFGTPPPPPPPLVVPRSSRPWNSLVLSLCWEGDDWEKV